MDHPMIRQIELTGYPSGYDRKYIGTDALGNEVYEGDQILVFEDEMFLVDDLTYQAEEILEIVGAVRKIAK